MRPGPTVSVVICAFSTKRWGRLCDAVASVNAQTMRPEEIVIVVDHNDELFERARERWPDLTVVPNDRRRGLSGARNSGWHAASASVVAFIDDDAVAHPTWLETLSKAYGDSAVLGAGGTIAAVWPDGRPPWFPSQFDWVVGCTYSGYGADAPTVRNLIGCNMSFRRDVLADLKGFDERFGRSDRHHKGLLASAYRARDNEDTEVCLRATRRWPTGKLIHAAGARVSHHVDVGRTTFGYFVSRCWSEGASKAALSSTAGNDEALSDERAYVSRTLPRALVRAFADFARGDVWGAARAADIIIGAGTAAVAYALGRLARITTASVDDSTDSQLRVLMTTPRFAPEVGGVERHVLEVSRHLAARGCNVTVLCGDRSARLPPWERRDGFVVRRVRAWPRTRDWHIAPSVLRAVWRQKCDLVHVQSYHTGFAPLAMLAACTRGLPYVVTFHGGGHPSAVRRRMRRVQWRLLRPLLARSARLIALADFEIDAYSQVLGLPVDCFAVIPNGIDPPPADVAAAPDGAPLIASVGRLETYKGHDRVITAFPHVLRECPDARLWVAGFGPDEQRLHEVAERAGVAGHVEIAGVPPDEMPGRLRAASAVVLLSDFETQPIAIMEAMALHRPVILPDAAWARELAVRGPARLVAADGGARDIATAIVEAIRTSVGDPAPRFATWSETADRLFDVYRDVLDLSAERG